MYIFGLEEESVFFDGGWIDLRCKVVLQLE